MTTSTLRRWATDNGYTYVERPSGAFLVVRPDGGTEERFTLPVNAFELVDSRYFDEDVA